MPLPYDDAKLTTIGTCACCKASCNQPTSVVVNMESFFRCRCFWVADEMLDTRLLAISDPEDVALC